MKLRKSPFLAHESVSLRFERTSEGLRILAVDARGLELLRPLARAIELAEGVREVGLYCDRILVSIEGASRTNPEGDVMDPA